MDRTATLYLLNGAIRNKSHSVRGPSKCQDKERGNEKAGRQPVLKRLQRESKGDYMLTKKVRVKGESVCENLVTTFPIKKRINI